MGARGTHAGSWAHLERVMQITKLDHGLAPILAMVVLASLWGGIQRLPAFPRL